MRTVAVFRSNLFRVSEPFITEQAGHLQGYCPVYLGRRRYGPAPAGAAVCTLDADAWWRSEPLGAWQMLTRDPGPYRRLLRGERPALVHAHFGTDGVQALPLARALGVGLVTTFHGFDATMPPARLLLSPAWVNYPIYRRQLARHGALFLCVSRYIRERVLEAGFPPDRTLLHHIGVDSRAVTPRHPGEAEELILHVGRLVEMKGTEYLLRAFALLAADRPRVRLVIVGDGALRRGLQRLAGSLGIAGRVTFAGALPHAQALDWMRRAALLVLPSVHTGTGRVEGLGMVLLEAAATGLPVVASRVGGVVDAVRDGETGFLVPGRDVDALSRRIGDLLDDPALRLAMGANARRWVEREFDIVRQTERLEALYDRVVAGAQPGA